MFLKNKLSFHPKLAKRAKLDECFEVAVCHLKDSACVVANFYTIICITRLWLCYTPASWFPTLLLGGGGGGIGAGGARMPRNSTANCSSAEGNGSDSSIPSHILTSVNGATNCSLSMFWKTAKMSLAGIWTRNSYALLRIHCSGFKLVIFDSLANCGCADEAGTASLKEAGAAGAGTGGVEVVAEAPAGGCCGGAGGAGRGGCDGGDIGDLGDLPAESSDAGDTGSSWSHIAAVGAGAVGGIGGGATAMAAAPIGATWGGCGGCCGARTLR